MRVEWPWLFVGNNLLRTTVFEDSVRSHLVRSDAGVLMSFTDVVSFRHAHEGLRLRLMGLSNVFTIPPFRHQGHASLLVEMATRLIDDSGADLALLFAHDHLRTFYGRFGWQALEQGSALVAGRGFDGLVMGRFLSEAGRETCARLDSAPLRLAAAW